MKPFVGPIEITASASLGIVSTLRVSSSFKLYEPLFRTLKRKLAPPCVSF